MTLSPSPLHSVCAVIHQDCYVVDSYMPLNHLGCRLFLLKIFHKRVALMAARLVS
jgi:hypothetical protein